MSKLQTLLLGGADAIQMWIQTTTAILMRILTMTTTSMRVSPSH